jgi:hypothetical protein
MIPITVIIGEIKDVLLLIVLSIDPTNVNVVTMVTKPFERVIMDLIRKLNPLGRE